MRACARETEEKRSGNSIGSGGGEKNEERRGREIKKNIKIKKVEAFAPNLPLNVQPLFARCRI
jgi:hypothetical protein